MCLQAHYRSELEFSWEGLGAALTRLKRMVMAVEALKARRRSRSSEPAGGWTQRRAHDEVGGMLAAAGRALRRGGVRRSQHRGRADRARGAAGAEEDRRRATVLTAVAAMDAVLGLDLLEPDARRPAAAPEGRARSTEAEIEAALARRKAARAEKDFATSDAIRDELAAQGRRGDGRRPARLGVEARRLTRGAVFCILGALGGDADARDDRSAAARRRRAFGG